MNPWDMRPRGIGKIVQKDPEGALGIGRLGQFCARNGSINAKGWINPVVCVYRGPNLLRFQGQLPFRPVWKAVKTKMNLHLTYKASPLERTFMPKYIPHIIDPGSLRSGKCGLPVRRASRT